MKMHNVNNPDDGRMEAEALISTLQQQAAETASWTGIKHFSDPVVSAIRNVPRYAFFPERTSMIEAYANRPQPIGFGQTISQPYIVALTSELLAIKPQDRVLEVGTGSGYQAAILAELAAEVYTVERIEQLANHARRVSQELGYNNIHVLNADGAKGWSEHAPYDAIAVTAAGKKIPKDLIDQLAPDGRMVIPVGRQWEIQSLVLGRKNTSGKFSKVSLLPVAFVPLVLT